MRLPRVSPGSYNQFGSSGSFQHVKEIAIDVLCVESAGNCDAV
jgi:hypothetical protein